MFNSGSMVIINVMPVPLHRYVVIGFGINSILQFPFKLLRRGGDDDRTECDKNSHEYPTSPVI